MLALMAVAAQVGQEVQEEGETLVPWSPFAYAGIAIGLFLVALIVVTRLNIER